MAKFPDVKFAPIVMAVISLVLSIFGVINSVVLTPPLAVINPVDVCVPTTVNDCPVETFIPPFAVIRPEDVRVVVSIDELFNVAMVSLPWAVGYVKKLFVAVAKVK